MNAEYLIEWLVVATGVYLVPGMLFGVPFVVSGVGRLDSAAAGSGWAFRFLVFPGAVALWPILVWKIAARRRGREEQGHGAGRIDPERLRRWHGLAWKLLAILAPVILGLALVLRPASPVMSPGLPASRVPGAR